MKILIVEDNRLLRENTAFLLKKFHFSVETAVDGQDAFGKILSYDYDAIILDVNMPIMDGKEFLQRFRDAGKRSSILALTSNSMLEDKLEMFELGVDDYLTKPFEIEELVARLRALGKRGEVFQDEKKQVGDISINFSSSKIFFKGEEIRFPHKQYLIVEYLFKNLGYPKNKLQIMEYVWGEAEENLELNSTTLESHIYAVRKKLGKNFIQTLKGVGYIIE